MEVLAAIAVSIPVLALILIVLLEVIEAQVLV